MIIIIIKKLENVKLFYGFLKPLKFRRINDMELKFDKNNQLKVRLAIVESQLKFANKKIKILENKGLGLSNKSIGFK